MYLFKYSNGAFSDQKHRAPDDCDCMQILFRPAGFVLTCIFQGYGAAQSVTISNNVFEGSG